MLFLYCAGTFPSKAFYTPRAILFLMGINEFLEETAQIIQQDNSKQQKLSSALAPVKKLSSPFCSEKIVVPVEKTILNGLFAGVDSGFVPK